MSFLPQDYNVPAAPSGYMKLQQGANKFRILSPSVVTGWEYWNIENKAVRQKEPFDFTPPDIKADDKGFPTDIKHFWAFAVWNYDTKAVQILQINQSSIQTQLQEKIQNRQGNANNNDFIITKTGEKLGTKYSVDVLDATPIAPEIVEAYQARPINLESLFTGDDPFAKNEQYQPAPASALAEREPMQIETIEKIANEITGKRKAKAMSDSIAAKNNATAGQNSPSNEEVDENEPPF